MPNQPKRRPNSQVVSPLDTEKLELGPGCPIDGAKVVFPNERRAASYFCASASRSAPAACWVLLRQGRWASVRIDGSINACEGNALEPSSIAQKSFLPPGIFRNPSFRVAALFSPVPAETVVKPLAGNDLVTMFTAPPAKPPCRSGVKVLLTTTRSIIAEGIRSSWGARRRGSALGSSAPLSVAMLYLSFSPRMTICRLSVATTPVILVVIWAASPPPVRAICSALMASWAAAAFFRSSSTAATVLGFVDASSKADLAAVAAAVDFEAARLPAPVPGLPWIGRTGAASGLRASALKKLPAPPPCAGGASDLAALAVGGAAVGGAALAGGVAVSSTMSLGFGLGISGVGSGGLGLGFGFSGGLMPVI